MNSAHFDGRHCVLHFLLKRPEAWRVPVEQNTHQDCVTAAWRQLRKKMIYTTGET